MEYEVLGVDALGRRARRRQRTRRALLDAALSLFAERGIAGTRLEDLTGRADLGKGAVYNYYEQAVGLAPGVSTLERMLAGGLPPLFEARRHAGAAAPIDRSRGAR